jgi:ribonuclease HI
MKWVRGHTGIRWNEHADVLAEKAARNSSLHADDTGYLNILREQEMQLGMF